MRSNFKNCIYAHKIVCNSRPIYEYNLDAMPMLLVRSLIYGRLNFKNCNPVEYKTTCKKLFVKHFRSSRGNSFKDLKSDWDLGVVKDRLSLNIFISLSGNNANNNHSDNNSYNQNYK